MEKKNKYHHYYKVNDETILKKTIKEKKLEVDRIMLQYKKSQIECQFFEAIPNIEKKRNVHKQKAIQFVKYIDKIISILSISAREYIVNEYIENHNNPQWWIKSYNRSTYFKVKKNAIEEFLSYVS